MSAAPTPVPRMLLSGMTIAISGVCNAANVCAGEVAGVGMLATSVILGALSGIAGRYRPTVESLFTPENPLVLSIPRLYPLPGHTPDAVFLSTVWEAAEGKVRLSWTVSAEADLTSYQIRVSPLETYDAEAESIVATLPGGGVTEYLTDAGLPTPGATASYKVYVILTTDNERGSNAVAVTRP